MKLARTLWGDMADMHLALFAIGIGYAVVNRLWWNEVTFAFAAMAFTGSIFGFLMERRLYPSYGLFAVLPMLSLWFCIFVTAFVQADTLSRFTLF